jgi:chemotaxis signal transduction protein
MSSSEQQKVDIRTPSRGLNLQDLERMSDEEFWEYARQRACAVPELPSHAEYLECKLSSNACLIALRDLAEVLSPPHRLARLPGMPSWMAGIMAWRGETVAIVDLDLYLLGSREVDSSRPPEGMLLIASQIGQTLGLLVPAIGFTATIEFEQITAPSAPAGYVPVGEAEIVEGIYADLPILNISALLTRLVQQIGIAAYHGSGTHV